MAEKQESGTLESKDAERFRGAYAAGERTFARWSLAHANLQGLDLRDAIFYDADLAGANLAGADLSRANLGRANLTFANLRGANLSGAFTDGARFEGADLAGTITDNPSMVGSHHFCIYCGTDLNSDAIFCAVCGRAQPALPGAAPASLPLSAARGVPPTVPLNHTQHGQAYVRPSPPSQPSQTAHTPNAPAKVSGAYGKALGHTLRALGYATVILGGLLVLYAFFALPDIYVGTPSYTSPDISIGTPSYTIRGATTASCDFAPNVPCNQTLTGVESDAVDPFVWFIPAIAALGLFAPLLPSRKNHGVQGISLALVNVLATWALFYQSDLVQFAARTYISSRLYISGPYIPVQVLGNPPMLAVGMVVTAAGGMLVAIF